MMSDLHRVRIAHANAVTCAHLAYRAYDDGVSCQDETEFRLLDELDRLPLVDQFGRLLIVQMLDEVLLQREIAACASPAFKSTSADVATSRFTCTRCI